MAAAAERARRAKEAGERYAEAMKCATCPKPPSKFGSQVPTTGTWQGEKGNSRWTSDSDPPVSLDYKEGYPDFKTSDPKSLYGRGDGEVEILMTGNNDIDFKEAREAMRKKLGDDTWPGPDNDTRRTAPEGYTWHHTEDGTTMQLVETKVHDKALSGAAHTGGKSIVSGKNTQF
jgi:hypothetical protein